MCDFKGFETFLKLLNFLIQGRRCLDWAMHGCICTINEGICWGGYMMGKMRKLDHKILECRIANKARSQEDMFEQVYARKSMNI